MPTQQNTPIAFSGNIPVNYDSYLGPMFFEPYAIDMANRIARFPVNHILELASGTGRLTRLLLSLNDEKTTIVASDINPAMVAYGKELISDDSIQWMEIDAVSLPFENDTFDCIAVQFGVMFYSDKLQALKEARRVLKPGGVLIFNCWDKISNNPMASLANETLEHFFPTNTPTFYSVPFSYFDENQIQSDLKEAGFDSATIDLVALSGYSASAESAAQGLIKGTPTITAIEERDPNLTDTLLAHLEERIAARFGKFQLQVPLQALVVQAVK